MEQLDEWSSLTDFLDFVGHDESQRLEFKQSIAFHRAAGTHGRTGERSWRAHRHRRERPPSS